MKKIATKIILGCIILLISYSFDHQASKYANGFHFDSYPLGYGTRITKVNDAWITYSTDNLAYIAPNDTFITKSKKYFIIDHIIAYQKEKDNLSIKFLDKSKGQTCFLFTSEQSVNDFNPQILNAKECSADNKDWVHVDKIPTFFYYWRLIGFSLVIIATLLFLSSIINTIKLLAKRNTRV